MLKLKFVTASAHWSYNITLLLFGLSVRSLSLYIFISEYNGINFKDLVIFFQKMDFYILTDVKLKFVRQRFNKLINFMLCLMWHSDDKLIFFPRDGHMKNEVSFSRVIYLFIYLLLSKLVDGLGCCAVKNKNLIL